MKRQREEPCKEEVVRQELAPRYLFTIDRDSLFEALAFILHGDEGYSGFINQSVMNYMQQHYQQMLGSLNSIAIETSANSMIAPIPDELLMRVVVEVLQININVYNDRNIHLGTYMTSSNTEIQDINIWYYHNEYSAAPIAQHIQEPPMLDEYFLADLGEGDSIVEQAVVSTDVSASSLPMFDEYFLSALESQEDYFPYMIDLFGEQRSDSPYDVTSLDF